MAICQTTEWGDNYSPIVKRSTNIYLYDSGLCVANEYIEDDSFGFNSDGTIYANSFVEEVLENGKFAIGAEFIASEISEIYIEQYHLVDEQGNRLTDENGNYLFLEEEV